MSSAPPRPLRRAGMRPHVRARRPIGEKEPRRRRWLAVLGGLVAVFLVWGIWLSGYVSIDALDIAGDDEQVVQLVREYATASLTGTNLLFFNDELFQGEVLDSFPQVRWVQIQRVWPSSVRLHVTAREPLGVWCRPLSSEQECYLFDKEKVWGSAVPSRGTLLLTVMDEHPEGAPYPELVDGILMIAERLRSLDVNVSRITLPAGPLDEIRVLTTQGYPVIFSRETDPSEQLDVLEIFLSEQRSNGDFSPEFIDVRVPGKVYFK